MKKIHLFGPSVTNAGEYRDAGQDIAIGDGKDDIAADRADDLLESTRAVAATEPTAAPKK